MPRERLRADHDRQYHVVSALLQHAAAALAGLKTRRTVRPDDRRAGSGLLPHPRPGPSFFYHDVTGRETGDDRPEGAQEDFPAVVPPGLRGTAARDPLQAAHHRYAELVPGPTSAPSTLPGPGIVAIAAMPVELLRRTISSPFLFVFFFFFFTFPRGLVPSIAPSGPANGSFAEDRCYAKIDGFSLFSRGGEIVTVEPQQAPPHALLFRDRGNWYGR